MVNRKAVILSLKPKEHQNLCFCALSFCVNYTLIGQCVLTMCAFFFFFLWIFPPKSIFYLINNPPFSHSLQAQLYCIPHVPSQSHHICPPLWVYISTKLKTAPLAFGQSFMLIKCLSPYLIILFTVLLVVWINTS